LIDSDLEQKVCRDVSTEAQQLDAVTVTATAAQLYASMQMQ